MHAFSDEQVKFLKEISAQEKESDWVRIPGYVELVERIVDGKIIGMAGVTMRYGIIPSLFIAVSSKSRGGGIASNLLRDLLKKWRMPMFLTYYARKTFLGEFYGKFGFRKIIPFPGGRILCLRL